MSTPEYAYFEGAFVPFEDAKISVRTHAFLYGTSIFEGIRGYYLPQSNSVSIFRMREHYERLLANSRLFFLDSGLSLEKMMALTDELVRKNRLAGDIYIRPTLYKSTDMVTPSLDTTETDFCLWTKPFGNYLDLEKGLSVCVSNWRRMQDNVIPARAKAGGAYMNTALAVTDARRMGFDDAIFLTHEGNVSEGSAMNLFLYRDGTLITPARTEDILEGITRDTVMEIARAELGVESVERPIDRSELYYAEEMFFCGTGAQVAAITSVDKRPVGTGRPGEFTQKLQQLYFDVVKNKLPKYSHWCHVIQFE